MTMTRRDFLSASAALAVTPALGARAWGAPLPREADIVVIGAGAAGIAAARRIQAANRKVIVVEASGQIGGRCLTDTATFEVPFDRGARWLHNPDTNPMIKLGARRGARHLCRRRWARKSASAAAMRGPAKPRSFSPPWCAPTAPSTTPRAARPMSSCASVLPKDLGDWAGTAEFVLGANATGKDLKDISVIDKARAQDRNAAIACRQGLGTLIAKLGEQLPRRAVDARQPHQLERPRCHGGDAGGQDRRARRHRHGVEQCAGRGQYQIHARHSQAPARCRGEIEPRQLRPHRAAIAGQSARAWPRRSHHRAEQLDADRTAVCQYGVVVAVRDRCRGIVRPRSLSARAKRRWWRSRWNG